jgi:hypothetical protein
VLWRAGVGQLPATSPQGHEAQAFDLLELNGADLRREPIEVRKATLASILRKSRPGARLNELLKHDCGLTVFQHACKMGLEGIVSKRLGSRYRSGRSPDWIKSKNLAAPAVKREREEDWMSYNGGRLCFKVCSASIASLVQVRAMSLRMTCTRGLEVPSAIFFTFSGSDFAVEWVQHSQYPHKNRVGAEQELDRATVEFRGREWRKNSLRHSATAPARGFINAWGLLVSQQVAAEAFSLSDSRDEVVRRQGTAA